MAGTTASGRVVLLLDNYSLMSRMLHESLQKIATDTLAIVITEDNFLPENVLSVYDLMIGNYRDGKIRKTGKPRFFNEIPAPDNWSFGAGIQVGDEKSGNITYQQVEKAKIHYVDSAKRWLVRDVEWYDRAGVTCFCDHYNRYGDICARTVYSATGEAVSKSWLSPEGREIIVEDNFTHDIILNDEDRIRFFRSREELLLYFLEKLGFQRHRFFINSLSLPLSLVCQLDASYKEDILFWQESTGDDIPWNMRFVLNGEIGRCNKVIVQTRNAYDRLLELGASQDRMQRLGFLYSYEKKNGHRPDALICTNADRIEHCEELIKQLPQMHFHIAALTMMSPALLNLGQYRNVSLYPEVEQSALTELFMRCDYYFDINHYGEMVSAVYQAFIHDQLIFAFEETVHNRGYVADTHIYAADEFERMVSDIQGILADQNAMEEHLERQHRWALGEKKETYKKILHL